MIVKLKTHFVCFDVLFRPCLDSAMAGLRGRTDETLDMPVHGIAYLLSPSDFVKMIVSEWCVVEFKRCFWNLANLSTQCGRRQPDLGSSRRNN